ncbi:DNA/RNA helicase domain-containing protein [Pedobacter sp. CG_S7]|uniref:DNA/RNA helicase domain-containing protein n=1 Tax=Pedobacter sp. CG_S7 TaxID=3143930 RepID=UPI0033922BD5
MHFRRSDVFIPHRGYDLNYTGVIFGKEITYNKLTDCIEIDRDMYFDKNGKNGIANISHLKSYIMNIYKNDYV